MGRAGVSLVRRSTAYDFIGALPRIPPHHPHHLISIRAVDMGHRRDRGKGIQKLCRCMKERSHLCDDTDAKVDANHAAVLPQHLNVAHRVHEGARKVSVLNGLCEKSAVLAPELNRKKVMYSLWRNNASCSVLESIRSFFIAKKATHDTIHFHNL